MKVFMLNEYSFSTYLLAFLTFVIAIYTLRFRKKDQALFGLRGFYFNLSLMFLSGFIGISLNLKFSEHFIILQNMFGQYALVFLILFVYSFQEEFKRTEKMIALTISIVIAILITFQILYGIASNLYFLREEIAWLPLVITLEFFWAFIVLIRKAIYITKKNSQRKLKFVDKVLLFIKTGKNNTNVFVKFSLLMLFSTFISFLVFFAFKGMIPSNIYNLIFTEGSAVFFFLFVLFYMDYSDLPISMISKIIGITMVSLILLLNLVGYFLVSENKRLQEKNDYLISKISKNMVISERKKFHLPEEVDYVLIYNNKRDFLANDFKIVYAKNGWNDAKFIYADNLMLAKKNISLSELSKTKRRFKDKYRKQVKYISFFFLLKDKVIEVGLNPFFGKRNIHFLIRNSIVHTTILLLLTLFVFPRFFKNNMIVPLERLLEGVKHLDKGEYNINIPVKVRDEFGILSEAFNKMASSIDSYRKEILEYSYNLEKKVAERTKELELKNKKLEEIKKKLDKAAKTDPLTQLFNRRAMYDNMKIEMIRYKRSGKTFSLILCDIDDFKDINDNFGHNCGDYVLKAIAKKLKKNLREQDIVSRWGGEEFLILLPETEVLGAIKVAEKLRLSIEEEVFVFNGKPFNLTMTFGVAEYDAVYNIDETINSADKAMYEGKNSGKNIVIEYKKKSG